MERHFKIPLLFLIIGAVIGVALRSHFVFPLKAFFFSNWLQAHSHTMFLGWITNALFLSIIFTFMKNSWNAGFKIIFLLLQLPVIGMLVIFPLQGYGALSITMLALHTIGSYVLVILFYKAMRSRQDEQSRFIRQSLLFYVISTIGAFSLGPLAAFGLQASYWYYSALFLYLHFQYNGFYLFSSLGLVLNMLKEKGISLPNERIQFVRRLLFWACFPAYLLSILWVEPGLAVVLIAGGAAIVQCLATALIWSMVRAEWKRIKNSVSAAACSLLIAGGICFAAKNFLQVGSAIPTLAKFISQIRFFILAYLHLVLIGVITFWILAWMAEHVFNRHIPRSATFCLLTGFVITEVTMVATPLYGAYFQVLTIILLGGSLLMAAGVAIIFMAVNRAPSEVT
jgi:hypothetical protein